MEKFVNTQLRPNFHGASITVIQTAGENQPFKNFHTKIKIFFRQLQIFSCLLETQLKFGYCT